MKIAILVEGKTELAFKSHLLNFLNSRLEGKMPKLEFNKKVPSNHPEQVNFNKPPSYHIKEMFLSGKYQRRYKKPRDAHKILKNKDLLISAKVCPEFKAFLNRILQLCDSELIL